MATIDVLLPIYNGAGTLREAIGSLQRQTFRDFRLIAVDDGSTDESSEILHQLARQDDRIQVLRTANGGIVDALNAGLCICTADYIARQDADDISDPARLQLELSYLKEHPACVAVSGAVTHIDATGKATGHVEYFTPGDLDPAWVPAREPYLSHPFLMVRRAAFNLIGEYRHVYHAEDADLYWRLREHGSLHSIGRSVGLYRMHPGSISSRSIVEGRIMALNSQLAALSAIRRMQGEADLPFPRDALSHYRAAETLEKIVERGQQGLNPREAAHLRMATSLKLLEMATYRPYVIDEEDCRYIRDSVSLFSQLSITNHNATGHLIVKISARLITKGLFREAKLLTPPALYFSIVPRLMFQCMPPHTKKNLSALRSGIIRWRHPS